jgi:hypothetical protein
LIWAIDHFSLSSSAIFSSDTGSSARVGIFRQLGNAKGFEKSFFVDGRLVYTMTFSEFGKLFLLFMSRQTEFSRENAK